MIKSQEIESREKLLYSVLDRYNSLSVTKVAKFWFRGVPPAKKLGELLPKLVDKMKSPDPVDIKLTERFSTVQRAAFHTVGKGIPASELFNVLQSKGYTDINKPLFELICKGLLLINQASGSYCKIDLSPREADTLHMGSFEILVLPGIKSLVAAPPPIKEKFKDIPPNSIKDIMSPRLHDLLEGLERFNSLVLKRKFQLTKAGIIRSNQKAIIEREITSSGGWGGAGMICAAALASSRIVANENGVLRPNPDQNQLSLVDTVGHLFSSFVEKARWADDAHEETDDPAAIFVEECYDRPKGEHIIKARQCLTRILQRLKNRDWVSLDDFTARVLELYTHMLFPTRDSYSYYYREKKISEYELAIQHEFVRCFLGRTCFRFGLVEIGLLVNASDPAPYGQLESSNYRHYHTDKTTMKKPKPSGIAFWLTELGASVLCGDRYVSKNKATACLQIGPDFEIIAPFSHTPLEVHAALSKCTSPVKGHAKDPVKRFKLERESVQNALRCGMTLDNIVSMLEKHSGSSLPANVSRTLQDWNDHFGRIKVMIGYDLLEFTDKKTRDSYLKRHPEADGVSKLFALIPQKSGKKLGEIIDYTSPPVACLKISQGRILIDENKKDLLIKDQLSLYAAPRQTDKYEITRASVAASPLTPEIIIDQLKTRCSSAVPADLITSIYGWAETLNPLPMDTVCILQVDDEKVRLGIKARKELQKYIVGTLSPSLFIVEKKSMNKLKSVLLKMGIVTSDTLEASSLSVSNQKRRPASKSEPGITLTGLVSLPAKQTRSVLEKAIENKREAEIFFLSVSRFSTEKILYHVIPKEIQRYSNRPFLVADYYDDGGKRRSGFNVFIKDILALRIIET